MLSFLSTKGIPLLRSFLVSGLSTFPVRSRRKLALLMAMEKSSECSNSTSSCCKPERTPESECQPDWTRHMNICAHTRKTIHVQDRGYVEIRENVHEVFFIYLLELLKLFNLFCCSIFFFSKWKEFLKGTRFQSSDEEKKCSFWPGKTRSSLQRRNCLIEKNIS